MDENLIKARKKYEWIDAMFNFSEAKTITVFVGGL